MIAVLCFLFLLFAVIANLKGLHDAAMVWTALFAIFVWDEAQSKRNTP